MAVLVNVFQAAKSEYANRISRFLMADQTFFKWLVFLKMFENINLGQYM